MGAECGVQVAVLADLMEAATPLEKSQLPELNRENVATIVYTSGTTGRPKGVMLRHGNLLHQTGLRLSPTRPYEESDPIPGHTMVALLPVWHITERTFELWMITRGCRVVYTSVRHFKNDLAKHQPEWLVLVPRVLEKIATGVQDKFNGGSAAVKILSKFFTSVGQKAAKQKKIVNGLVVGDEKPGPLEALSAKTALAAMGVVNAVGNKLVWSKVQEGFGGNLKAIICGGSALSGSLETFFETAGINILVGYGLTECSPLLSYRRGDDNLVTAGCVGKPAYDTEVRVVDPEALVTGGSTPPPLPDGQAGVVLGRGPQVMLGYYKNEKATAETIDPNGWFNSGDLGRINPATGDLILTGRAKDTIVLSNGENIEPTPIEDAILGQSSLVDQVMLTGQDGRRLVAIAVLSPNELANAGFIKDSKTSKDLQTAVDKVNDPKAVMEECKEELELLRSFSEKLREDKSIRSQLMSDVSEATSTFQKWERVGDIFYTLEPFAMANGLLTQSYKVKRNVVTERYESEL
uniref:AMP-dependent synthetase/ligase domain-containing protein n=1 Tax=Entomoneis paludosa TaxID=265537 RepID=A0A6U3B7E4_9STRA